jgi:membrane-bound lytic murein transglycosylase D
VTKNIHQFTAYLILLGLLVFVWGCASAKKPAATVPSPEPPPAQEDIAAEPDPDLEYTREILLSEVPSSDIPAEADKEDEKDPNQQMEDAMTAYQAALLAWDQGDLENAVLYLDESYRLILDLEIPPDSLLEQEKNDLRLLIAQRIQEIHASQATAVGGNHGTIPLEVNQYVQKELDSFTNSESKLFAEAYRRSGRYREIILEELRKEGLPEELAWMPVIESWFKVRAFSRASALGLWQFIASTGYRYGLKRDRYIDERMDPEKSTTAAVQYLKELHSWFGDWTTALAAYNCGETRVRRLINAQRVSYMDNFWDLYQMLPRETRRFVPRFIATVLIVTDPAKYGMRLPEPDPPLRYETVAINKPVKLATLSSQLGLDAAKLAEMNPELRHSSTPENNYELKVPVGTGGRALETINTISRYVPPEASYVYHYVRRGETVSGIAGRYRTSISAIAQANRLGRRYLIRPGQRLRVPTRYGSSYSTSSTRQLAKQGDNLVYNVKRGDTLYHIAQSFRTSVQNIKRLNSLRSDTLQVGQKLIIHADAGGGTTFYTVRSGDTPFKIAQRFGMNLNQLLNINGLNTRSKIYPGQKLRVSENK